MLPTRSRNFVVAGVNITIITICAAYNVDWPDAPRDFSAIQLVGVLLRQVVEFGKPFFFSLLKRFRGHNSNFGGILDYYFFTMQVYADVALSDVMRIPGRNDGSFHYLRGGRGSIPEMVLKTLMISLSRGSAATRFCCSSGISGVG